jgi:hypothetical protein
MTAGCPIKHHFDRKKQAASVESDSRFFVFLSQLTINGILKHEE